MPIEDNSVDYFRAGSPIRIGTVSQGAETRLEVANLLLGARYDGPKTNTTLSDSGADKDQILRVGDSFSVKSAASPSQHIKLTLVGTGTYTTYPLLGAPVTRIVLIGETAAKQQYVVFPNADAPDLLGNLAATLNIRSAGYDFGTHEISNCYLPGTQILTDHGTVAVEELREGDMVVCRFGCLRPVRWIGWQRFAGRRAAGQEAIRFAPGSIADDMPRQPLFVSPGHSMLVGETLVLAADLVNGITITREAPREEWTYFQIDLGDHDMVLANGAWSESFADCGAFRSKFDNFADFRLRFPDHVAPEEPILCAPRPAAGAPLHAALHRIAQRALVVQQPAAPGRLEGRIEGVAAPCHVAGWAMDADHRGTPVMLEVVLDGEVIGRTCACAPRKEARDQGPLGFVFEGGRRLSTHELLRLVVRRAQDGQAIAPLPSAAVGQLQGHLDLVSDTCRLEGWARDKAFPNQPVLLEVLLGEEVLGTVLACRRRRDLEKAGLGDVAFVFEANRPLSADEIETIHLRRINDRAPLCRSDQTRIARDDAGKSKAA